ncbi:putative mycobactin biosynthesis enzyme MbtE [Trichinella spiralis]|uniref:putative mycobactin biosynthesis enzyme MbtE n=1 Tax=Trichinella spiralis TaxID=6334 RepID=UPI0001EFDFDF|nr:putative mycobactin biosynthesis enzyme MbtE [Trichinella spiralis]
MDSVHYELTAGYTGPAIDTPGAFLTDQLTQSLRGSSEFPLIAQDPFFHYFHLRQLGDCSSSLKCWIICAGRMLQLVGSKLSSSSKKRSTVESACSWKKIK